MYYHYCKPGWKLLKGGSQIQVIIGFPALGTALIQRRCLMNVCGGSEGYCPWESKGATEHLFVVVEVSRIRDQGNVNRRFG